jgi:hypothetical protein
MAAIYTTRKKDEELGVAEGAKKLAETLNAAAAKCIAIADEDASAYAALQARHLTARILHGHESTRCQCG